MTSFDEANRFFALSKHPNMVDILNEQSDRVCSLGHWNMNAMKGIAGRHGGRVDKSTGTQPRRSARIKSNKTQEYTPKARRRKVSAAQQAVLNTAELLENVLIYVPFHTLITAQRVCSMWRDTINQSKTIRHKLFRWPKPIIDRWAIVGTGPKDLHLLKIAPTAVLPQQSETSRPSRPWHETGPRPEHVYPVRLHPLLQEIQISGVPLTHNTPFVPPIMWNVYTNGSIDVRLVRDLERNYSAPSWRNMYLCNPPCTIVDAHITFESSKVPVRSMKVSFTLEAVGGVTFGLLMDRALDADMVSRDGKKCCKGRHGHSSGRQYLEQMEAWHGRPAHVSSNRSSGWLRLRGCVAPSEEEWEAVSRGPTVSDVAVAA